MAHKGGTDRQTDGRTEGRKDRRTYGRLEIPPCVLQDISPLGPLPKKRVVHAKSQKTLSDRGNKTVYNHWKEYEYEVQCITTATLPEQNEAISKVFAPLPHQLTHLTKTDRF